MALLVGEARKLPDSHPYTVFHRLAHRPKTQDKVALLYEATAITYHQLGQMVDSLSLWLEASLERMMRRGEEDGNKNGVDNAANGESLAAELAKLRTGSTQRNPTAATNVVTPTPAASPTVTTTIIALCLPRSPVLVALILAIWKRGWAYVPLDPIVPALRTLYVIKDSRPACIITDTQTKIRIKGLETDYALATSITTTATTTDQPPPASYVISDRIMDVTGWEGNTFLQIRNGGMDDVGEEDGTEGTPVKEEKGSMAGEESPVQTVCSRDSLACVLYTSGSSGDPKGVRLTVENIMNRLAWQWEALPFTEDDVCLMSKSLTFVDSLTEAMVPLLGGAPLVVVKEDAINPELLIRYVCQYSVTRVVAVPSLLKLLLLYLNTTKEATRVLLQQVRVWVTSGEPLPGWLANDFHATFPSRRLLNLYGSTEVAGDVTWCPVKETNWKPGVRVPVGAPLYNTAILILRGEGAGGTRTLADEDQIGEVAVLGTNVSPGYLSGYVTSSSSSSSFRSLSSIIIKDERKKKKLYDYLTKVHELMSCSPPPTSTPAPQPASVTSCEAEHKPSLPSSPAPSQHQPHPPRPSSTPPTPPPRVKMGTTLTQHAKTSTPPPVPPRTSPRIPPRRLSTTPASPATTAKVATQQEERKAQEEERKRTTENQDTKKEGRKDEETKKGTKREDEKDTKKSEEGRSERSIEDTLVYLSGDLGRVCKGQVVLEGRRDSQVKVRGVRVHLAELQDALHCSGYVANQCVLATGGGTGGGSTADPDAEEDQVLVAFVVLKAEYSDQDTATTEDLTRCLRLYLPQAVVPRVVVLDALPHLPSGKVDRQALLRIYRRRVIQHRGSQDGYLILRKDEPIESRVLRIICGALGVSRSQDVLQKNFFDLGGTSITSVSVVVRLRELDLDLSLESFLKAATIGDVVNDILKAKTMAEVMNLFCSPCPAPASTSPTQTSGRRGSRRAEEITLGISGGGGGGRGDMEEEEEEEDDSVVDMGIPALHPDLPVSCRPSPHALQAGKTKGIRLAQLHTLPVSQGVDKATVIEMVAESFAARNPLDVAAGVTRAAHRLLLGNLWPCLVHDDLSFVVKDPKRGILGVAVNTDLFNEPLVEVPASMDVIASLHAPLEEEARHYLRQEGIIASASPSNAGSRRNSSVGTMGTRRNSGSGSRRNSSSSRTGACTTTPRWLHNLYLATSSCLSPQDNVRLSLHLEKEVVKLAKNRLYHGVFTVNSNPLNQLLCETFLGYERTGAVR
ncbi:uncharacterized protein LOC123501339 [Portunus trituberculatus]|uniref:uncharacterized protein LOC123501339 n=1 Tax=Portunus trituberculatus TaxID=210409 RepID=UPI001E1D10E7|nr:uncharacterized protein LOC123501339 [Portunus trituberculatus]XP_045106061.1 uncharacterized protein LOC123501339 [Portunus trituberculatus]